ncbi:MAG: DNA helicase-2/ATP-dependent DNA helicase PcrA, partial [Spirosomataceae bacterium]
SIYDTTDSKSLIRTLVKEQGLDDKVYRPNQVYNKISSAKNALVSWESYLSNPVYQEEDKAAKMPELGRLYRLYQLRCFQANAMDFDDLLFNTNVLFRDHLDVLNKYQHKFKHVLVDEFQDTNISQYLITRKLSAEHENICVVGDDAQSIYAFRGANIQNILNFKTDYPDLHVVKLEQNYRSTKNIVEAANSVIRRNKEQFEKNTFTDNDIGKKITVIKASSDNEEGRLISTRIFETKVNEGFRNTDFAILYRTNAQSRAFEEALRKIGIKYRIIGGLSFYQRKEIKDLLSYMRYAVNQQDEEAFKRIINLPKRGIGNTTVAKIVVTAAENNKTIWEVVSDIHSFVSGRSTNAIDGFADLIKSYMLMAEKGEDAYKIAEHVAKSSGILKELYADKTVEGLSRYENIQELLNSIKQFVDDPENEETTLSGFLQTVSLLTSSDEKDDDGDNDRVTLMTIHGAKGLEFKNVYVVGMEENLFPSQMMLQNRADLEEERRLFYVAITRAEDNLTLSYAQQRYNYGRLNYCEPSRFLSEIDEIHLDFARTKTASIKGSNLPFDRERSAPTTRVSSFKNTFTPSGNANGNTKHEVSENFAPSNAVDLRAEQRVEHQKFGFGTVLKMEGSQKATVNFDTHGEKTLLLSFAKLRIVE